jgi:GNAT superfamily N-acetyltransferase
LHRIIPKEWKVIDLRKNDKYIPQYVDLRNSYINLLLTSSVTVDDTKKWLTKEDVEIRCIIDKDILIGAVILYLNRNGEIAFFARHKKKGIGSRMLRAIEEVAKEKRLNSVWAWVLTTNLAAHKTFIKNGYIIEKKEARVYKDSNYDGIVLNKKLRQEL